MLSFQNNPSEFLRYLRADKVLESQGLLTPRILEENKSLKYLLMDYYPTNNSSKYFKREEIKTILPRALQNIIHLQKPRKKFSGIPEKAHTNLMKDALKGIETYIGYFDHKIQIGYYLNRLIQLSLKKNLEKITKYKPRLAHGDFFLENLIYYKRKIFVIDHQDLHYNHPCLDIASLIFDARRQYSSKVEDRCIKEYAKKSNQTLRDITYDIHLVSLARNLRILGNWINLYRSGKPQYLKKYRKATWTQIFKHVEYLRFWDLRELFEEVHKKTK
jgi:aminoglycoside/choline kinase family phosphotransferase